VAIYTHDITVKSSIVICIQSLTNFWLYPIIWYFPEQFNLITGSPEQAVKDYKMAVFYIKVALVASFYMNGWIELVNLIKSVTTPNIIIPVVYIFGTAIWIQSMVYNKIGDKGVYYGCKLGFTIPWCSEFPFDTFRHPQYFSALSLFFAFQLLIGWREESSLLLAFQLWFYSLSAFMEESTDPKLE
jgi:hypothetical protein